VRRRRWKEVPVVEAALAVAGLADEVSDAQLVVGAIALMVLLTLLRVAIRHRRRRPAPGEVWFAQVPFDDGTGSKDRPVLVLSVHGRSHTVARFTSQDRSARRDHLRVPDGLLGLQRSSWVDLRPVVLPRKAFRRRVARPGGATVEWYARESGWSTA
jgi:hypothetical protein